MSSVASGRVHVPARPDSRRAREPEAALPFGGQLHRDPHRDGVARWAGLPSRVSGGRQE